MTNDSVKSIGASTPVTIGLVAMLVAGAFWTGRLSERQSASERELQRHAVAWEKQGEINANLTKFVALAEQRFQLLEKGSQ